MSIFDCRAELLMSAEALPARNGTLWRGRWRQRCGYQAYMEGFTAFSATARRPGPLHRTLTRGSVDIHPRRGVVGERQQALL